MQLMPASESEPFPDGTIPPERLHLHFDLVFVFFSFGAQWNGNAQNGDLSKRARAGRTEKAPGANSALCCIPQACDAAEVVTPRATLYIPQKHLEVNTRRNATFGLRPGFEVHKRSKRGAAAAIFHLHVAR